VKASLDRLLADHRVLECLPDIIAVMDRECHILHLNHGVPGAGDVVTELVGASVLPYIVPDMRDRYREVFQHVWATGERQAMSVKTIRDRWWDVTMVPLKQDDDVLFVLIICHDVTQQRDADEALRESERRLRHAISASGMGTWEIKRGAIRWDDAICRIFGIRPEEAPRRVEEFLPRVHPDDREAVTRIIQEHRRTGVYDDFEHRLVRPDGEVRHVISRGTPPTIGTRARVPSPSRPKRRCRSIETANCPDEETASRVAAFTSSGRDSGLSSRVENTLSGAPSHDAL
jgi:PAS domain S-box-containing protein